MPPPKSPARSEIFPRTCARCATSPNARRNAGAELVVFPEMADTGYAMEVIREQATPWNEGAVPELQDFARTLSLGIISGVSEKEDGASTTRRL